MGERATRVGPIGMAPTSMAPTSIVPTSIVPKSIVPTRARSTSAAALVAALGLLVGMVAVGSGVLDRADAAPVPIYNAPAGGGEITYETIKIGPIHLEPMGMKGDMVEGNEVVPRPAGAYGIKSMTFDLVDDKGASLDPMTAWLHHFVIATVFHKDPVCPDRKVAGAYVAPLAGTGMERTPMAFPDPYVLPVGDKDVWGATYHVMNMSMDARDVYIQYTVGMQKGATPTNSRYLTPFLADVTGCGGSVTWDVPGNGGPGSIETRSVDFTMPKDGIMVGTGGHLHDGGIDTELRHEDGSLICRSIANYDWMNMLSTITPCQLHETVAEGEVLHLASHYDNSAPHLDVMGINMAFVWFGSQGTPPTTTSTTTSSTTTIATTSTIAVVAGATAAQPVTVQPTLAG